MKSKMFSRLIFFTCNICIVAITIGAAFDEIPVGILLRSREYEESLNKTIDMINSDTKLLLATRLLPVVEILELDSSYQASSAICRLLSRRVWAIIVDQPIKLMPVLTSIAAYYHIPLILLSWQPQTHYFNDTLMIEKSMSPINNEGGVPPLLNYTVNLHPVSDQLSQAYLDLIRYKGWKSFTILYDTPEDFVMVEKTFEMSNSEASISLQKLYPEFDPGYNVESMPLDDNENSDPSNIEDRDSEVSDYTARDTAPLYCDYTGYVTNLAYRKTIKELMKKNADNIILSISLDKICRVLKEASSLKFLSVYNDFVIANLDIHLLNLTQLGPFAANISGFTILDPSGQATDFTSTSRWLGKRPTPFSKRLLPTGYTMMSDSVSLIASALDEMIKDPENGRTVVGPNCDCSSSEHWPYGNLLMNHLKMTSRQGSYSGDVKFDQFGQRINFNLEYILYKNSSFHKVGEWNLYDKLADRARYLDDGREVIKNRTLIVSVARTSPYVMYRENHTDYQGNERYEGYCIDLLKKLARKLHFRYIIQEVKDGQYGKINNGSWNGMVRELLERQADLAIVDLTITKERQSAVDFTHPFMTLGIAIMYKKPKLEEAEMYSFLMPFSKEVWLSMWSAYVGMSLTIWLVSRLSPLEWSNPHPCYDNPNELDLENEIHSIGASMWFTIGSLMQQGSDLAPRSLSVRALASVWYFFTLILMSSYTANFAAFLTASRMQSPIESAEDLSKQTKIDYGCKDGGSTQAFFASSNHSTYRRMWNFMESRKHQGVFPKDNSKGINMVKKGNFAFLMESTSIDYMVQRDCELTQIGGLLDHKGYGIALPKRSPYRAPLSKSIVELNEAGELQDLKNRWWNSPNGTSCGEEKDSASATSELGIDKVGGVFVMLGVGVLIACIAALLEFVWKSLKVPKDERVSMTLDYIESLEN